MHWIDHYQLFLFDFDGILVNTEKLHYLAYKKMCAERGFLLKWDLPTYIRYAMYDADGLQKGVYAQFPELKESEPCWDVLYQEKKAAYADLLQNGKIELMPGAENVLDTLEQKGTKRCVVTHSSAEQVARIRSKLPILNSIPLWITREDYNEPKPAPECYQIAIDALAQGGDRIIGFEDSPRGLKALLQTEAEAVLVTTLFSDQEIKTLGQNQDKPFKHISSLNSAL